MPTKPLKAVVTILVVVIFALGIVYYVVYRQDVLTHPAALSQEELQKKAYDILGKMGPAKALVGRLAKVESGVLTVVFDREMFGVRTVRTYYVKVGAGAPILIGGRSVSLGELKIGDNLTVSLKEGLDPNPKNPQNYTATRIDVIR